MYAAIVTTCRIASHTATTRRIWRTRRLASSGVQVLKMLERILHARRITMPLSPGSFHCELFLLLFWKVEAAGRGRPLTYRPMA
jgi:hypothetical protein